MKEKTYKVGDLVAFEINGELFASRITKIEGTCRQMANTINLTKGCMAGLRGTHDWDKDSDRDLTREENQRYHDIFINKDNGGKHYQGEDYMPAGTCIKMEHYICLTAVDVIKEGKVDNFAAYAIYDLDTKTIPSKVNFLGGQIEQPTEEEKAEYWDAIYKASTKA